MRPSRAEHTSLVVSPVRPMVHSPERAHAHRLELGVAGRDLEQGPEDLELLKRCRHDGRGQPCPTQFRSSPPASLTVLSRLVCLVAPRAFRRWPWREVAFVPAHSLDWLVQARSSSGAPVGVFRCRTVGGDTEVTGGGCCNWIDQSALVSVPDPRETVVDAAASLAEASSTESGFSLATDRKFVR